MNFKIATHAAEKFSFPFQQKSSQISLNLLKVFHDIEIDLLFSQQWILPRRAVFNCATLCCYFCNASGATEATGASDDDKLGV